MISRDDWIKAIADAMPPPPVDDAITVTEFAGLADCTPHTARKKLLALVKAGKAVQVRKRMTGADGRRLCLTAYQLTKPKRK